MVQWLVNNDMKLSGCGLIVGSTMALSWGTPEKPQKTSVKIMGVLPKIQTKQLLITSEEHYYLYHLFSGTSGMLRQ